MKQHKLLGIQTILVQTLQKPCSKDFAEVNCNLDAQQLIRQSLFQAFKDFLGKFKKWKF